MADADDNQTSDDDEIEVVVVEVPMGSRNKYEIDHDTGEIYLDRRLFTATRFPVDYGYFPGTLADDGDPVDALVLLTDRTFPGCRVRVRVIGAFILDDTSGPDAKVVCGAVNDPTYGQARSFEDLDPAYRGEIEHFFAVFKDLEPGSGTSVGEWSGPDDARHIVEDARRRAEAEDEGAST